MRELVSIIIPLFNKEEYLDKCLNSLLNQSFEDFDFEAFKGKKIFITEKDSAADYAFRYILKAHGLEEGEGPDFVEIDYTVSNEHAVQAMLSGSVEIIIIGEPYATAVMMKNKGAQKIFDLCLLFVLL